MEEGGKMLHIPFQREAWSRVQTVIVWGEHPDAMNASSARVPLSCSIRAR